MRFIIVLKFNIKSRAIYQKWPTTKIFFNVPIFRCKIIIAPIRNLKKDDTLEETTHLFLTFNKVKKLLYLLLSLEFCTALYQNSVLSYL